ncbi:MAG TPA: SpoIIE family protein phosphatase [Gallionellaceae bacterium]
MADSPACSLELPAPHNAGALLRASEWLKEESLRNAVPAEQLERIDLFLNEALANIIDHGGPSALAAPILLRLNFAQLPGLKEATITLTDAGMAFDPLAHPPKPAPKSLDEAIPGGLGIPMIRSLADEMSYAYLDNQNHLAFTVRWITTASEASGQTIPGVQVRPFRLDDLQVSAQQGASRPDMSWMPLFRGTDVDAVLKILNQCDVLILPPGTPLLKPGAANEAVFILLDGSLSACLDSDLNPEAAIPIAPGECIGEMSAIDGKPVTALVVATDEARVLKVPPELFFNRLLTIPGVARNLLIALTERMRRTNETMMEAQRKQLALHHLHQELDVARQLQASMLPLRNPMFPERDDLEIAALMQPASEVGGDLFDAFFVDDSHLFICIGDVSGHGIPAALFMARSIGLMRIAAMSTMRPDEVIGKINEQLCTGNDTNLFITLFCGFLNVKTGRLVYSNGGHCAPILISGNKASAIPIPKGALVGALPGLTHSSLEMVLAPEDTLVCYTDGVTEAQPVSGEEFSEERLIELLRRVGNQSTEYIVESVRQAVTEFTGSNTLDDDYTLLVIRRHPERTMKSSQHSRK